MIVLEKTAPNAARSYVLVSLHSNEAAVIKQQAAAVGQGVNAVERLAHLGLVVLGRTEPVGVPSHFQFDDPRYVGFGGRPSGEPHFRRP